MAELSQLQRLDLSVSQLITIDLALTRTSATFIQFTDLLLWLEIDYHSSGVLAGVGEVCQLFDIRLACYLN